MESVTGSVPLLDPHFHFFDLRPDTRSGHDGRILELPEHRQGVYDVESYEKDMGKVPEAGWSLLDPARKKWIVFNLFGRFVSPN